MPVELGNISLQHLTHISVHERARLVHHEIPGMSGSLAQALGRPSVEVLLSGIFYGESAIAEVNALRAAYLENEPLDFFTEAVGEGYFSQVLISRLEMKQRAGYLNQFDYVCEVIEYVEPPEPAAADPFGALDAELLTEATSLVDDLQDTLDVASQLTDLIANVPSFSDPTPALKGILGEYSDAAGKGAGSLTDLKDLF